MTIFIFSDAHEVLVTKLSSLKSLKIKKKPIDTGHIHSCNHHKWLSYEIQGGKSVKDVEIDEQTMETWPKHVKVTLSMSE